MGARDEWDVLFKRDDLTVSEIRKASREPLKPGEVRLAVERFGLTANNATYARFGDDSVIAFWRAFPGPQGYGRVPIWGFARVEESSHPDIAEGSRYFGYMPMSTHHVVAAEPMARGFIDTTAQRDFLHPWYRTYELVGEPEPLDDRWALLHPVYPAAFNLADFLERQAALGARSVLITSASSKVAIGLVEEMAARQIPLQTVGLTADRHTAFVQSLDLYDTVAPYGALPSLTVAEPTVFVDLTGDPSRRIAVCERFKSELCQTVLVGFTHSTATVLPPPGLAGPEPQVFFTPAIEMETIAEEGADSYYTRYAKSERRFVEYTQSWLDVRGGRGPEAIIDSFRSLLAGEQPPDASRVLRP
ncbi:DUF2855 family protein [Thermomonospora cellulosilytica]|uniref:DUF2855 family protein n=1 Tax=Thermomonospora cellulosilytica TaxID=1411118 RepID=A0A7W3N586_9ACTN|nr:DUF2855 family protein [Thermomonospora cellulosilytica]MBA9007761.1 hypothetical protein [Thermomonospora cellulosilytica]